MTEDFFNTSKYLTRSQIQEKYSDTPFIPIVNIPHRYMSLFKNATDSYIYCGKQTLAVHVNKHNDVPLSVFQDMQKVLNNTDNVYIEKTSTNLNGQKGVAFEVLDFLGERYAMVVRTDRLGRLIFWKTFHIQREVQDKWKKINLAKKQGLHKSVEGGQFSISQTSNASSSDLSAFPDNFIIPDSANKSTPKPAYNGQNVRNKSFIVGITDITENNKAKKWISLKRL